MKLLFAFCLCFLGLFLSKNADSSTLECSDVLGKTLYSTWNYDGGAPPFPGMITRKSSIIFDHKVLDQTTIRMGYRFSSPEAKFSYSYSDKIEIDVIEQDNIRTEFFGVLATIKQRTDYGFEDIGKAHVICKSQSYILPPP